MRCFLSLLVFVAAVQCESNNHMKRLVDSPFSGRKNIDRLRSHMFGNKNKSSVRTNPNRAVFRECYDQCTANFRFEDTLDVSTKCPSRVSAYECSVDIKIFYDDRSYTVDFIPELDGVGLEYMDVDSVMGQEISFQYPDYPTKSLSVAYYCHQHDECEWDYVQKVINKFTSTDFQPVYDALATSLYNSAGSSVDRCYEQSSTVTCPRRQCTSYYNGSTFQVRGCVIQESAVIRIDIESKRSWPASVTYDRDYFSYVCNRDLCNSPSAESSVRSTIQSYSSVLEGIRGHAHSLWNIKSVIGLFFTMSLILLISQH